VRIASSKADLEYSIISAARAWKPLFASLNDLLDRIKAALDPLLSLLAHSISLVGHPLGVCHDGLLLEN
jgi:hypothetical protein